jgi:lambda repressor-like predicted transcriptional regulator
MQDPVLMLPSWVPAPLRNYLSHTAQGVSLRELARRGGVHASTVLRQVRRYENRRDDPLLDEALVDHPLSPTAKDRPMTATLRQGGLSVDAVTLEREGRRILRRLAEAGAMLAIAPDMDRAVVLRDTGAGRTIRTAVVDRGVAQAFVLQDWIAVRQRGRVTTYDITAVGRAALRRMVDGTAPADAGDQHRVWGERVVVDDKGARRLRHNLAESPIAMLGRRRDKDGKPFLDGDAVQAGERLREDFEAAQMGPRVAQNWERFLTAGAHQGGFAEVAPRGSAGARDRVALALRELGPGLGDVALRVCCFLEGVEVAEKRMGWASRSGKIVLRIALTRLRRHYDETYGKSGPLIG